MLDMIRNSIKDTSEAAALFYDELARIVQLGGIDPKIEVHSNFPQHSVPTNNWNRPFNRYGGHIEFIRFKEYYGMPRGQSLGIYARFSGQKGISMYISREKGDRY